MARINATFTALIQRQPALSAVGVTALGVIAFPAMFSLLLWGLERTRMQPLTPGALTALWTPPALAALLALGQVIALWSLILIYFDQLRQAARDAAGRPPLRPSQCSRLAFPLILSAVAVVVGPPMTTGALLAVASLFIPVFCLALHWHLKHLDWPPSATADRT